MLEANVANKNTDGIIPENPFVIWKELTIVALDDENCNCELSVGSNMKHDSTVTKYWYGE